MARAKKTAPDLAPETAVAHALVEDLAAGLEAVKAGGEKAVKLPPSSLGTVLGELGGVTRSRIDAAREERRRARVERLKSELVAVETQARALESTDPLPSPHAGEGERVLDGSLKDGATGTPLPAV